MNTEDVFENLDEEQAREEMFDGDAEPSLVKDVPVDMTKDEYIAACTVFHKLFGMLRGFSTVLVTFSLYLLIIGGSTLAIYLQTNTWDPLMVLLNVLTVASGGVTLFTMKRRVVKTAEKNYDAGNVDGYYGEITVTADTIRKKTFDGEMWMPLDERTIYIEDEGGMQFMTKGLSKALCIPARCATEELSAAIRKAVFAPQSRVRRRVLRRMPSLAAEPIEAKPFCEAPPVLCETAVRYEPEEIQKMVVDTAWENYVQSLPSLCSYALLFGTLMAMMDNNLPVFFVTAVAVMLGMLVLTMLSAKNKAKAAALVQHAVTMRVRLTEQGVRVDTRAAADAPENCVLTRWCTLTRAVERTDCVEFIGAGRRIRVPKRCILDLEHFCQTVDAYYPPKS